MVVCGHIDIQALSITNRMSKLQYGDVSTYSHTDITNYNQDISKLQYGGV